MFATEPSLPARLQLRLADFAHPSDVAADAELSRAEKRRIPACWASDAHVPDSRPYLRWLPGTPGPVPLRSVLSALRALDQETASAEIIAAASSARGRNTGRERPAKG